MSRKADYVELIAEEIDRLEKFKKARRATVEGKAAPTRRKKNYARPVRDIRMRCEVILDLSRGEPLSAFQAGYVEALRWAMRAEEVRGCNG